VTLGGYVYINDDCINIPLSNFLKTCIFLLGIPDTNNASWKKEENLVRLYAHRSKGIQAKLLVR